MSVLLEPTDAQVEAIARRLYGVFDDELSKQSQQALRAGLIPCYMTKAQGIREARKVITSVLTELPWEASRTALSKCVVPLEALHADNLAGSQLIAPALRTHIADAVMAIRRALLPT